MKNVSFFPSAREGSTSFNRWFSTISTSHLKTLLRVVSLNLLAGACLMSHAQTNEWAWMGGSSTIGSFDIFSGRPGVYGTLGVLAPGNIPGGRQGAVGVTDINGNFWLFGGEGIDSAGNLNGLNDLWEFNASAQEWAWMSGSSTVKSIGAVPGVYGTLGVPTVGNTPGGRISASAWTDSSGNLWLFGGNGYDSAGVSGPLNDLWEFSPSTLEWAWIAGASEFQICGYTGNSMHPIPCPAYGTWGALGVFAAGNTPAGRDSSAAWTDSSGNLWLMGGEGPIIPSHGGSVASEVAFNDLWEFKPSIQQWAWVGGCSTGSADWGLCSFAGIYGTQGVPSASNMPGMRDSSVSWTDKNGNFWLFGGDGFDSAFNVGALNDLWELNPSTLQWTWMGGSSTLIACGNNSSSGQPQFCSVGGAYGTLGAPSAGNAPGARTGAVGWTDNGGNLWLFGGSGYDSASEQGDLNDLWAFNPPSGQWTWMGGDSTVGSGGGQPGVYGTLGTPGANMPGGRNSAVGWTSQNGNLWLFGGQGYDAADKLGYLNDLWEYQPLAPAPTAAPSISPAPGTYTSPQSVTIGDATLGAIIYYTTDGTTPTSSSTEYSGAITVSATETIQAIAIAPGNLPSAAVVATYTIPAGFTVSGTAVSVTPGANGTNTSTISVTSVGGFTGSVTLTAAITSSPSAAHYPPILSFGSTSPLSITGSTAGTATLTVSTTAPTRSALVYPKHTGGLWYATGGAALAWVLLFGIPARRRRLRTFLEMAVLFASLTVSISACGGGTSNPGTTPGAYVVTVTATSGALTTTGTVALVVQ